MLNFLCMHLEAVFTDNVVISCIHKILICVAFQNKLACALPGSETLANESGYFSH